MPKIGIPRNALSITFCFAVFMLLLAGAPAQVVAQNCARCESCSSCGMSAWGGVNCSFEGGCCREGGGNCNPKTALLDLQPTEILEAHTGDGLYTLARLDNTTYFVAWSCEAQQYVLYRYEGEGSFVRIEPGRALRRLTHLPHLLVRELIG